MLADFGVSVDWTSRASTVSLTGLFDRAAHVQARFSEEVGVVVREAILTVVASDVPAPAAAGDAVLVDGEAYLVRTLLPDGQGMVSVHLEKDRG